MRANILLLRRSRVVPVFFAADDKYIRFMAVTMKSLIANSSPKYSYRLYVLHTDITPGHQAQLKHLETGNCKIFFVDVTKEMEKISKKICLRDYYSATTYYRIFISELFPQYKKVLYIDSDTVVRADVAELYRYDLGKNYIGAIRDQIIAQTDIFADYAEKVLGISRGAYFNAGVVLINCERFRKDHMLKQFIKLLGNYTFVVAQDQDYLNILCKDRVLWLDPRWNVQMPGNLPCSEDKARLVHYNMALKPWHYKDCRMGEYFWEYAKQTEFYDELIKIRDSYTGEDKENDRSVGDRLQELALSEINNRMNYNRLFGDGEAIKLTRAEVLNRIAKLEKSGVFDKDVEDDPPGRELKPGEIDYLRHSVNARLSAIYAFRIARWFVSVLAAKKQFVVKEIKGIENLKNLDSGAIITCNHFNAFDSFAMQVLYDRSKRKKKLFRVISEANYTAFPGFYGLLMRNCNTLPLSSNKRTMMKFMMAVSALLQRGNCVLIYPEQSMWWNYRKPKPLKRGGFILAVDNNVPVLPVFITMEDTDVLDGDGYPVQAYTINVGTPIYPSKSRNRAENIKYVMEKNSAFWKETYETFYHTPLTYTCDEKDETEKTETT
ncbi:MAG: 1-acyl-sn-glycerol-3-phosphate acyltransferase [Lachnospiraceae bacterium]|nr:1-acyl-sn-glycerol-3-phosphate acyltransferase [Lachnospiraceae bacterium]